MNILITPLIKKNQKSILSSSYVMGNYASNKNIKIFNHVSEYNCFYFSEILKSIENEIWKTDLIIFWKPEHEPIPIDIKKLNIPIIGIITDWSIELEAILDSIKYFDWIFTDLKGVSILNKLGFNNVSYWTVGGYVESLHKKLDDCKKIYDVVFIGNLNNTLHNHRTKWLYRLSKLSNKYNIKIIGGVYGEEYVKIINQSKIVFNHSIRGELNMRSYETLACGSLLFQEEENLEISLYFKNKKEYISYSETDFEDLLEYYINNDIERENIANSGNLTVQNHSYEKHFKNLLDLILKLDLKKKNQNEKKQYNQKNLFRPNSHILYLKNELSNYFEKVCKELTLKDFYITKDIKDLSNFYNDFGIFLLFKHHLTKESLLLKAENLFLESLKLDEYSISNYNIAILYSITKDFLLMEKYLNKTIKYLKAEKLNLEGLIINFAYSDDLKINWENANIYKDNYDEFYQRKKNILLDKIYEIFGDLYIGKNLFFISKEYYEKIIYKSYIVLFKLGKLEYSLGNKENAEFYYKKSLEKNLFNLQCTNELMKISLEKSDLIQYEFYENNLNILEKINKLN